MTKEKRKSYRIKEMKRKGLSYVERGNEIHKMKQVPLTYYDIDVPSSLKPIFAPIEVQPRIETKQTKWSKFINWIKKILKWLQK